MDKKNLAKVLATAAAVAFVTSPIATLSHAASMSSDKVKCFGVNACKGKSACATSQNSCKGQNACKGKGMKMMTAAKCEKMKGTTEEPKS